MKKINFTPLACSLLAVSLGVIIIYLKAGVSIEPKYSNLEFSGWKNGNTIGLIGLVMILLSGAFIVNFVWEAFKKEISWEHIFGLIVFLIGGYYIIFPASEHSYKEYRKVISVEKEPKYTGSIDAEDPADFGDKWIERTIRKQRLKQNTN